MASKENTFIGVFDNQSELLGKVAELKAQGYDESDMYVVGRDHNSFSNIDDQSDVHVDTTEVKRNKGFMGKFMSALSGESSSLKAFHGMGLDRHESKEYYQQVQNGKLVLYVDSGYGETYNQHGSNYTTDYSSSSGVNYTSPIETGATFAPSSSAGSTSNVENTEKTGADSIRSAGSSASDHPSSSSPEWDSEFGRSISADGSSLESGTGTTGGLSSSTSRSGSTFGSASGSAGSASRTTDDSIDRSRETDRGLASRTGDDRGAGSSAENDAFGSESGVTEEERLRLHEERLNIGKERVQTGEVNVGKHVVEENQSVEVPVEREEVYVERRPVNEEAVGTEAFEETDTIHVPVSEERVNVSKKDVVSEEIVVSKRKVQDTEQVNETVRREVADIDEDSTGSDTKNNNDRF